MSYNPKMIEPKWQRAWDEARLARVDPRAAVPAEMRVHLVEMLPYPSGKLHMGHVRVYSIGDVLARFQRMNGKAVHHPMGWDAFGLPAENAAIEEGVHPASRTRENIAAVKTQMNQMGWSLDWDTEIASCDPEFYRWNQWFFLKMLEKDLAYRATRDVNWCPKCATVLANEQVEDGKCWRCDSVVEVKALEQWFLRLTRYAQELHDALADGTMDGWPERIRLMQLNWIGRSVGCEVTFGLEGGGSVDVFTTRVDTIFGCTYLCVAPEHPLALELAQRGGREAEVRAFVERIKGLATKDRALVVEKEGVATGAFAVNPFNGETVPVWVANFVLMEYGTGAVMSVPAHDERDHAFAVKYCLPIPRVITAAGGSEPQLPFTDDGIAAVAGAASGKPSAEARTILTAQAEAAGFGKARVTFRIKDWGISRQRYWGTPIPIVHCADCGAVPVPERDLPVRLPEDIAFKGLHGNPLAASPSFVKAPCPKCGKEARRETDTMDTFVDSAWYYFRYLDPHNAAAPFDRAVIDAWFPIGTYIGGPEHAVMHLIYTRFWTRMMRDLGLCAANEPAKNLVTQGMVVSYSHKCPEHGYRGSAGVRETDGAFACSECARSCETRLEKMSKSKKNGLSPDELRERYGADTMRLFSLFAAPPEKDLEWSDSGVEGCWRFLNRLWRLVEEHAATVRSASGAAPTELSSEAKALRTKTHQTIRKVTQEIGERLHLNTAVAALMELTNAVSDFVSTGAPPSTAAAPSAGGSPAARANDFVLAEAIRALIAMLNPYAPHMAHELHELTGGAGLLERAGWPSFDPALCEEDSVTYPVQVNGKLRATLTVPRDADAATILALAKADGNVMKHMEGKTLVKEIVIPNRIVTLVVK